MDQDSSVHVYVAVFQVKFISLALVVDQSQAVKFALDIASGMAFLHTLEPMVPRLYLNSKHIMVRSFFWPPLTAGV